MSPTSPSRPSSTRRLPTPTIVAKPLLSTPLRDSGPATAPSAALALVSLELLCDAPRPSSSFLPPRELRHRSEQYFTSSQT